MNYIGIFLVVIMLAFSSIADEKIPVINYTNLYEEEQEEFLLLLEELISTNELIYGPGKKHSHGFVRIKIALPDYIDESRQLAFFEAFDATLKDAKNNFRTRYGAPLTVVAQQQKKLILKPVKKMDVFRKKPKVEPLERREQVYKTIAVNF